MTWRVGGDLSAPVAGLRALLLQALHPLVMAGVDQHSRWRGRWQSDLLRSNTRPVECERDLVGRVREARRRLAADGPPRVRAGGDFERVSVPVCDGDVLRDLLLAENPGMGRDSSGASAVG